MGNKRVSLELTLDQARTLKRVAQDKYSSMEEFKVRIAEAARERNYNNIDIYCSSVPHHFSRTKRVTMRSAQLYVDVLGSEGDLSFLEKFLEKNNSDNFS